MEYLVENEFTYRTLLSPPIDSLDEAKELKTAMFRAAKYFCSCGRMYCTRKWGNLPGQRDDNPEGGCPRGGMRVSFHGEIVTWRDAEGNKKYRIEFEITDKKDGIRAVIEKYGTDPNNWPYNPRAKKRKAED